jgi:hypothetical protein
MNASDKNPVDGHSASGDFEETLRLVARLNAPEGLEDRVLTGLQVKPISGRARILAWPVSLRLENAWMRAAAAAAIAAVVIGGGWSVVHHAGTPQSARVITIPQPAAAKGGFSSAGAMRTPQTLNGPVVAPVTIPAIQTTSAPTKNAARHGMTLPKKNPNPQVDAATR